MHWRLAFLAVFLVNVSPAFALGDVELSLYGHIGYNAAVTALGDQRTWTNSFYDSQADVFLHGAVDRLSYLSEIVLEVPMWSGNDYDIDVERIIIMYQVAENFRIAAGRFHGAIGYYNDAYHHGTYYLLSTFRPLFVEFEDSGGMIESHGVGVHADGRLAIGGSWRLRYDVEVTNGRGATTEVVNLHDLNNDKAYNLRLRFEPGGALDGLLFGGNVYIDTIPAGTGGALRPLDEQSYGAHLAYLENNVHLIAELMYFRHREQGTGTVYEALAYFIELGYAIGDVSPYVRYENSTFKDEQIDGFFAAGGGMFGSYQIGMVGVRYLASENIAIKGQASLRHLHSGSNTTTTEVQCAFGF